MERVTYQDKHVQELLGESFVGLKLEQNEDGRKIAELLRPRKLLWSPLFLILGASGVEFRHSLGYFSPREFMAELLVGGGNASLATLKPAQANALFERVVTDFHDTKAAPEALFWQGIAQFRHSRDKRDLSTAWQVLLERFPDSLWAEKSDFIEELAAL